MRQMTKKGLAEDLHLPGMMAVIQRNQVKKNLVIWMMTNPATTPTRVAGITALHPEGTGTGTTAQNMTGFRFPAQGNLTPPRPQWTTGCSP